MRIAKGMPALILRGDEDEGGHESNCPLAGGPDTDRNDPL